MLSASGRFVEDFDFRGDIRTELTFLFNNIEKSQKDACFQNFRKMSVLFFYPMEKEKIK